MSRRWQACESSCMVHRKLFSDVAARRVDFLAAGVEGASSRWELTVTDGRPREKQSSRMERDKGPQTRSPQIQDYRAHPAAAPNQWRPQLARPFIYPPNPRRRTNSSAATRAPIFRGCKRQSVTRFAKGPVHTYYLCICGSCFLLRFCALMPGGSML